MDAPRVGGGGALGALQGGQLELRLRLLGLGMARC